MKLTFSGLNWSYFLGVLNYLFFKSAKSERSVGLLLVFSIEAYLFAISLFQFLLLSLFQLFQVFKHYQYMIIVLGHLAFYLLQSVQYLFV